MGPIGGVILHGLVTGPAGELFSPASRAAGYVGNGAVPNVLPEIGVLMELYTMGLIKAKYLKQCLRMQGVEIDNPKTKQPFPTVWGAALEAHTLFPDLGLVMRGKRTGQLPDDLYERWLHRHKAHFADVKDYLERMNYEAIPPAEILAMWNRQLATEEQVELHLKDRGITDAQLLDGYKQLRYEIPPITDLLHFAQTNATDPAVIDRFGLADEFPRFWQGDLREGLTAQGISERWARIYWQAHWIRPSIGQAQEALQRLRPGRVPPGTEFGRADFENVMRENDVLPFWRERLRLLAYAPPGLRFIRTLYQTGQWKEADVSEGYQDLGYSPIDAPKLAKAETVLKNRVLAEQGHGYTIAAVLKLFKENIVDEQKVRDIYKGLGYEDTVATAGIEHANAELQAEQLKQLIALLRQQFLHGETDKPTAIAKLTALLVPGPRITMLIGTWEAERQMHAPHATLSQLQAWVQGGLLSLADFAHRLSQVGWSDDDVGRLVAGQAAKLDQHRVHELGQVQLQHRRAAMHAYKLAKAMDSVDLLEAITLADNLGAEQLLQAHTAAEKEHIKAAVKAEKAKVRGESKVTMAQLLKVIEDMPPP